MIYLNNIDIAAVEYIYDKYNRDNLFQMDDYDLKELVYSTCDELSWANEEAEYNTCGEHYDKDVDFERVYDYILKEKGDKNENSIY